MSEEETAPTIKANRNGEPGVAYSIEGHVIDRNSGQNGRGWAEGYAHTLNATDRHGVVYPVKARTLTARMDASHCVDRGKEVVVKTYAAVTYVQPSFGEFREDDIANTLKASDVKRVDPGACVLEERRAARKYIVRRLTPTECGRLQGFPDGWVEGANGTDSAIYKMWGNGIALPCVADVLMRLAKELRKREVKRE